MYFYTPCWNELMKSPISRAHELCDMTRLKTNEVYTSKSTRMSFRQCLLSLESSQFQRIFTNEYYVHDNDAGYLLALEFQQQKLHAPIDSVWMTREIKVYPTTSLLVCTPGSTYQHPLYICSQTNSCTIININI